MTPDGLIVRIPAGVTAGMAAGGGRAGGFGGCGGKGGGGVSTSGGTVGEVRFDQREAATVAQRALQGSVLNGASLQIHFDPSSQDQTKLQVMGITPGTSWKELKDHFSQAGQVAFANIK